MELRLTHMSFFCSALGVDLDQGPVTHRFSSFRKFQDPQKAGARKNGPQVILGVLQGLDLCVPVVDHPSIEVMEPSLRPRHGLAVLS